MRLALEKLYRVIASTRTSCVLFLLLLLLTFYGTLYQVEYGLYPAQQKYFASFFLVHWAFGAIPIPLPGAYLILVVLFANLLCGAIFRARKGWAKMGTLITHVGILLLLLGAFVAHECSDSGYMLLHEGDRAAYFEQYRSWEIVAGEEIDGQYTDAYVLAGKRFDSIEPGEIQAFSIPNLPFDLSVDRYIENCDRVPGAPNASPDTKTVGGYRLLPLASYADAERNTPGAYITLQPKYTGEPREALLWGGPSAPVQFIDGGKSYSITLRRQRSELPFRLTLDSFTHEMHPRSNMPKEFKSSITKEEGGVRQAFSVTMNEPFRHQGYTFYQSSWGMSGEGKTAKPYTILAVVRNPAEQWPQYACLIITLGMALHFVYKLSSYLKMEARQRP